MPVNTLLLAASVSSQIHSEMSSANDTEHSDAQPISTSSNTTNDSSSSPESSSSDTLENSLEIVTVKRVSTPDLQCLIPEDYVDPVIPRVHLAPEDANRGRGNSLKGQIRCASFNSLLDEANTNQQQMAFPTSEIPNPIQMPNEFLVGPHQIYANQASSTADNKPSFLFEGPNPPDGVSYEDEYLNTSPKNNFFSLDSYDTDKDNFRSKNL